MKIAAILALFLLTSCVGGTLSSTNDLEEYPLRAANEKEGKRLKACLKAAHAAQTASIKKTGKIRRKVSELPIDDPCNGFIMGMKFLDDGYEIMAQFHENDTTVRWSVNQDGIIEEHLDTEVDDDLGFE